MPRGWSWGRVGYREVSKACDGAISFASALQSFPGPLRSGAETQKGRGEASAPSPEPFFSFPRGFREPRLLWAGSEGGWWGWRGTGTRCEGRFTGFGGTECSDPRAAVWPWRSCARLDSALQQRSKRCTNGTLAVGPMASCASIDIEDATQHLRDILKLDRPAVGEPGQRGWAFGERAKGQCGPGPRSGPGPSGPALHSGW